VTDLDSRMVGNDESTEKKQHEQLEERPRVLQQTRASKQAAPLWSEADVSLRPQPPPCHREPVGLSGSTSTTNERSPRSFVVSTKGRAGEVPVWRTVLDRGRGVRPPRTPLHGPTIAQSAVSSLPVSEPTTVMRAPRAAFDLNSDSAERLR